MEYRDFIPEGWIETKKNYSLDSIKNALDKEEILQGFVYEYDSDFNLHIKLGDKIYGIIPRNEVDFAGLDENGLVKSSICKNKLNSYVQFRVKEICDDGKIILSRKEASETILEYMGKNFKEQIVVKGIIKNIRDYGVFIEIGGGVVGLLHIEDISVSRIKTPEDRFFVGQKVNVIVKSVDIKEKKVVLSYKELLGTWEENIKDIEERTKIKGTVRETDKYKNGIFIELKPNLVGLAEYKERLSLWAKSCCLHKKDNKRKKENQVIDSLRGGIFVKW